MKILFVDVFDAESALTWSGTPSRILERLRRSEEVILCHKLSRIIRYLYMPYILECKLRGLHYRQADRHRLVARHYAYQVRKAYELHKPDLVFSVGTPFALAYLPAEIPTAFWGDALMNQLVDFYWPSANIHKRIVEAGEQLDKLALQKSKAALFSSEWAAKAARRFVPESSDRIFFVPFGANTISDPPLKGPKSLPVDPSQTVNFLFVGFDWNRKGGQDAVDALNILRSEGYNVRLSIVGASPLSDGVHSDFIHQYGFLRRDVEAEKKKLQHLNEEAHFFIMPTHAECSPIVFAEAASYALPVIARDVGGVSSMVDRNLNGILIDHDDKPKDLADAIRPLLSDPERYRAMSAASLDLFTRRLNWETAVAQVIKIFEDVLEARPDTD
jgi:glycosyltransferase involved in cell wall biosynthesis